MSLVPPALPPIARSIASLIGMAQRKPPEVPAFLCVDPVETAADKLSALVWRVHARHRGGADDDPTIIRHLQDLAALKATVTASADFSRLVRSAMAKDGGRAGEATAPAKPRTLFAGMLGRLSADPLWAAEYRDYVGQVSFAAPAELIGFDQALAVVTDLVALFDTTEPPPS
jgi:hypothetical protein